MKHNKELSEIEVIETCKEAEKIYHSRLNIDNLNQKGSKLVDLVRFTYSNEADSYQNYRKILTQKFTGSDEYWSIDYLIDREDRFLKPMSNRIGCKKDKSIIDAIIGNSFCQKNDTKIIELPSSQIVPIDYGVEEGKPCVMNKAKLLRAIKILEDSGGGYDNHINIVLTFVQAVDLMNSLNPEQENLFFKLLRCGFLEFFRNGILNVGYVDFILVGIDLLPDYVVGFCKSGVLFHMEKNNLETSIIPPEKLGTDNEVRFGVKWSLSCGATRLDENKVVKIEL